MYDNAYAALGVQHAIGMGMSRINICDFPPLQYFSTLSHKWHAFRKKNIEQKMCFLLFSLQHLFEMFLILR
jgi:hypothetical protein